MGCEVMVTKRAGSSIQRIGYFSESACGASATVVLLGHRFCWRHARLFAEGHIDPGTLTTESPNTMADIRRSWAAVARGTRSRACAITPFYEREVQALFGDETKRWEAALGRKLSPRDLVALERGLALSEVVWRSR